MIVLAAGVLTPASPAPATPVGAEVNAWGSNWAGQLGDDSIQDSQIPVRSHTLAGTRFTAVASGDSFSIGLAEDGTVYTWGTNSAGQLGTGSLDPPWSTVPVPIATTDQRFTAVDAWGDSGMALTDDGQLLTWGYNYYGQLGNGDFGPNANNPTPAVINPPEVTFTAIAAGYEHALALAADNSLYAWGHNWLGAVGDGTDTDRHTPKQITTPVTVTAISAGKDLSMALSENGVIYTWGHNNFTQLGDDSPDPSRNVPGPVTMPDGVRFTSAAAGFGSGAAMTARGAVYTWGDNGFGQLGNGNPGGTVPVPTRIDLPDGIRFTTIDGGDAFYGAVTTDGAAYMWGDNADGALGDATTTDRSQPTKVASTGLRFLAISAGTDHTLALTGPQPHSITATGGSDQTVHVNQPFPDPLTAKVTASDGSPVPDVKVTFTIRSPATFPGDDDTATATTGADGVATSPRLTATGESGKATVTATVAGVAEPATYTLTVLAGPRPSPTPSGNGGGLPNTGSPVAVLLALGAALIAAGLLLTTVTGNRRARSAR